MSGIRRHRPRAASIVTATAIAVVVAGCGSSSKNSADSTAVAGATGAPAKTCAQLLRGKPPAHPPEIRFGSSSGAEAFAGAWTNQAMPQTLHPHQGTWYTYKFENYAAQDRATAFAAGQLDGFTDSAPQSWEVADKGLHIQLVATLIEAPVGSANDPDLVVRQGSPITGYKDLQGKKVGVLALQSSIELSLRSGILGTGGDPRDVTPVQIAAPSLGAAVRNGQVDAAYVVQPFQTFDLNQGGLKVIGTQIEGLKLASPQLTIDPGIEAYFSKEFLAQNPAAVCAWVSDVKTELNAANKRYTYWRKVWMHAGLIPAGANAAAAQAFLKTPAEYFPANPAVVDLTSQKLMANLAVKTGMIKQQQVPDWSTFVWPLALRR